MVSAWKILVPFNGSKESDRAFSKAIELAKMISKGGIEVEVDILYVVHELVAPNRLFDHDLHIKSKITGERLTSKQYMKEIYQDMKLNAQIMLDRKSQEIDESNIRIKTYTTHGYPSDKILQFAEKHRVNLISIGNAGRTGLSRFKTLALGSVSRSVTERADCPVMICH